MAEAADMNLQPCPFCQTAPISLWVGNSTPGMEDCGYWAVECRPCGNGKPTRFVGVHGEDRVSAEARWNARTPLSRALPKPLSVKAAFTLGGAGSATCSANDELLSAIQTALAASPIRQIQIEEAETTPSTTPRKTGETPRTDAAWAGEPLEWGSVEHSRFCASRDLERELAEAKSDLDSGFMQGAYARLKNLQHAERTLSALEPEIARLEALVYVPGVWNCAKCKFTLVSTTLNATSGHFKANTEPQKCPNGCGPLWRKTERDAGNELIDRMDQTWNTAIERAANECERQIDSDERSGRLQARSVLTRCAAAIRGFALETAPPAIEPNAWQKMPENYSPLEHGDRIHADAEDFRVATYLRDGRWYTCEIKFPFLAVPELPNNRAEVTGRSE